MKRRIRAYSLKRFARLLSVAVLAGFLLSMAAAPVQAHDGEIETEFAMVENPAFVAPITGAIGTAEFELEDGKFDLEMEAEGLLPNKVYTIQVAITIGSAGAPNPAGPGGGFRLPGTATTDDEGKLEFEIEDSPLDLAAEFPAGALGPGWRVDFGIVDLDVWSEGNCDPLTNPCRLVCAPTTRITPADLLDDDD